MSAAAGEIQRDIAAVFFTTEKLTEGINALQVLGLENKEISLLCSEQAAQTLQNNDFNFSPEPSTQDAHAGSEGTASTVSATFGSLSLVASAVGGAAIVASAGIFGGAVAVATAASVVAGGLGALAGSFMSKSDADALQNEIDAGHYVLVARTEESALKDRVVESLETTSGVSARILKAEKS